MAQRGAVKKREGKETERALCHRATTDIGLQNGSGEPFSGNTDATLRLRQALFRKGAGEEDHPCEPERQDVSAGEAYFRPNKSVSFKRPLAGRAKEDPFFPAVPCGSSGKAFSSETAPPLPQESISCRAETNIQRTEDSHPVSRRGDCGTGCNPFVVEPRAESAFGQEFRNDGVSADARSGDLSSDRPNSAWRAMTGTIVHATCRLLDDFTGIRITIFGTPILPYKLWGCIGFVCAVLLGSVLVKLLHLSWPLHIANISCAALAFLLLAKGSLIMTGKESLTSYHYQLAVLASSALVLQWLEGPVLQHVDVTVLGIALFLVFGRIGCFMAGCCHGRPHDWGVSYGAKHVDAGFPRYLMGVRLLPVQLLEAVWILFVVCGGIGIVLGQYYRPGDALSWYVVMYGLGRFCLEFLRGDADRVRLLSFTEPQWTSTVLVAGLVWAEKSGFLPYHSWHCTALAFLVFCMFAVALLRRFTGVSSAPFFHPDAIRELSEAMEMLSKDRTSDKAGLRRLSHSCIVISVGTVSGGRSAYCHYGFSGIDEPLSERAARRVSRLIMRLKHRGTAARIVKGPCHIYHLLVLQ